MKRKLMLMSDKKINPSRIATSPPKIINNTFIVSNSYDSYRKSGNFETFGTQDHELLDILERVR